MLHNTDEALETVSEVARRRSGIDAYQNAISILDTLLELSERPTATKESVVAMIRDSRDMIWIRMTGL